MPRCVICDYCSEIDEGPSRSFQYSHKEQGYVCSDCTHAIGTDLAETSYIDEGLGESEVLAKLPVAEVFDHPEDS